MKTDIKIVFDFDGPIANSLPDILEFTTTQLEIDLDNSLSDLISHFMTTKHARDQVMSEKEFLDKTNWGNNFIEFLKEKKNGAVTVPLFEDFITEIRKLEQKEFGIISSGTSDYIVPSVAHHADIFPHVLCFNHHPSKVDKMIDLKNIMGYGLNENIVYITDTLSDVIEFEDYLGLDNIYGVSWGVHSAEILSTKLADSNILYEFSDLHKIL